jgi:hypothetical protein
MITKKFAYDHYVLLKECHLQIYINGNPEGFGFHPKKDTIFWGNMKNYNKKKTIADFHLGNGFIIPKVNVCVFKKV